MDLEIHAESFGDMRRLHTGRDAAFETHVTAQEMGRLTQQPRRVLIEATERQFRSHQWDSQLLTKLLVAVNVPFRQGVLEPMEIEIFDDAADTNRGRIVIAPRGIEHQWIAVADRLAHRRADFDVLGPRMRRVDLICLPAARFEVQRLLAVLLGGAERLRTRVRWDAVAKRTEQLVDGKIGDLTGEIPQCHIDGADRANHRQSTATPNELIEPLAVEGILLQ